jgi:cation diffusion facilitator family transporter
MALLADGWHMASHVFALGLAWMAYVAARKYSKTDKSSFDEKKLLALSGFSSALALQIMAIMMAIESIDRFLHPLNIMFNEAIIVAVIGLVVNGLSAFFLHDGHEHRDLNIHSAYLHVLADGLTSLTAIAALLIGKFYHIYSLDSVGGIISSLVISKWAIDLIRASGKELINYNTNRI